MGHKFSKTGLIMGIDFVRKPLVGMKRKKISQFPLLKIPKISLFPKFPLKIVPKRNGLCRGIRLCFLLRSWYKYGNIFLKFDKTMGIHFPS